MTYTNEAPADAAAPDMQDRITATRFPDHAARKKEELSGSWADLQAAILGTDAPSKGELPWIKLARFGDIKTIKGSLRHDANVLAITGIEADYDAEKVSVDEAVEMLRKAGIKGMVYTSPSHTSEKPRWRVLCPVSVEMAPDQRARLVGRLNGVLGGILAGESFTLSQSYYFGSVNKNPAHRAVMVDGEPIDLLTELDAGSIGRPGTKAEANTAGRKGRSDINDALADIATGASYHAATTRLAGKLAAQDVPIEKARGVLEAAFDAVPVEARDGRWEERRGDVSRCLADIYAKEEAKGDDEEGGKKGKTPASDLVIDAVLGAGVTFWRDADGEVYARVSVGDGVMNLPIRGKRFETVCRQLYGRAFPVMGAHGKRPGGVNDNTIATAISAFTAMGLESNDVFTPGVRLAEHEGAIWIDLGDDTYRAIRVTADGWTIESRTTAPLVRRDGMRALPVPVREDGSLERLRGLLNIGSDDDFRLACAWLVAALRPVGPYPIIAVDGEQGSGKSTTCRMLRKLVDPNAADLRALARDEGDLLIAAVNSRVIGVDNVSSIAPDMADALCRVATGGGFGKRALYSNLDETIVSVCRPILLNGIPAATTTRSDLADRSIALTLPVIPEDKRRDEAAVWGDYDAAAPGIFALLLDGLAMALKHLPSVKLERLPRMADFAKLACAAAPAFGWGEAEMAAAIERNRQKATEAVVEGDTIASAILEIADENPDGWTGTATNLLEEIREKAPEGAERDRTWPKDAARLSARVKRVAPNLRRVGVVIEQTREGGTGKRVWRIAKTA